MIIVMVSIILNIFIINICINTNNSISILIIINIFITEYGQGNLGFRIQKTLTKNISPLVIN